MTTDIARQLDLVDLWDAFATKAGAIGTTVERAPADDASNLIRTAIGSAQTFVTQSAGHRFPPLQADLSPAMQARLGSDNGLVPAADVVAAGVFAVAETGSVLVCERNEDRAACMLAERLWLLVPAEAIVPTLDEALARIGALVREGAPYVTLMSGPSRTADIERTLTIGVHGPRALVIVVVGDAER